MNVELASVSKTYGGKRALDQLRFELLPGRVVAVVGLNGVGKPRCCIVSQAFSV